MILLMEASVLSYQMQMSAHIQDGVRHKQAHPRRTQVHLKDELMAHRGRFKAQAVLIMEFSAFLLTLCSLVLAIEIQFYFSPRLPCYGIIVCFLPCKLYSPNITIRSANLFSCNRAMVRNRMRSCNGGSRGAPLKLLISQIPLPFKQ